MLAQRSAEGFRNHPDPTTSNVTYENTASKDRTKLATSDDNVSHPNHKGQKMVRDENTTNESKYEDFSALCSRVSRPMHSSARDLEDPLTTAANALQDPAVTKSTVSETYEIDALVGEKTSEVVGYATLSIRLAAQIQSSDGSDFEDHISTETVTIDENFAHDGSY